MKITKRYGIKGNPIYTIVTENQTDAEFVADNLDVDDRISMEKILDKYKDLFKDCKSSDPKRIFDILYIVEEYWVQHPDLRLGQLVSNISSEVMGNSDPYYISDNDLYIELKKRTKKGK